MKAVIASVIGTSQARNAGGGSLPTGGTDGQALRKLGASAEWSTHWVVDPTTGAMSSTLPDDATPIDLFDTEAPMLLAATSTLTAAVRWSGSPPETLDTIFKVTKAGNLSLTAVVPGVHAVSTQSGSCNTQIGYNNTQSGIGNTQSGNSDTQSGYGNAQSGNGNTQSGYGNVQSGYSNTQSGSYNTQSGYGNTQSGNYGTQSGEFLNNGGFDHTFMVGNTKTATVGDRAYFALDNGIWIKPVAAAPASPENGVIYYDSTTHKFRGYANGAWVDLH